MGLIPTRSLIQLLLLSAAFDTTDHDNLFCILEKYVGILGNALKLIKSYFSNRTHIIIIAVGRMRQRLPSFPVLLYGVSPYISL